ncbi:MAG TPA: bifunctional pyr operon transcriptional regulator/uracil phosphoribosyltransferase PyrR [Candidatus Aminicenantes bacterium]|nr:bifunctional pyr operon transcriptional regulator/uracil phosphoribosyltransferase PyrR [Candidatus Aminicenantes bacterium]HRY65351.1 bifunctional pyr operon transcriptional regulator/uracil phosphoribosyltransferase PyrR [Candidatus Aminicenantes bacterium]HRZ72181.1 bifunctional pyr operon transcriptional regulator/uracil phosphoribosyltransferase PyrR [Candidatus Aminicenantes bacterium]
MEEKTKARIMDATRIRRVLARVATEIIERNRNLRNLVIVAVKPRGLAIGRRLARQIKDMEGVEVPTGLLDYTHYRDDIPVKPAKTKLYAAGLSFGIAKKNVVLVDDVLMTGRTIRAAMDAVIAKGRPQTVQLAVLVDRGHRELPICPDYIGKILPTSRRELVRVRLRETDGSEEIVIAEPVKIAGARPR